MQRWDRVCSLLVNRDGYVKLHFPRRTDRILAFFYYVLFIIIQRYARIRGSGRVGSEVRGEGTESDNLIESASTPPVTQRAGGMYIYIYIHI